MFFNKFNNRNISNLLNTGKINRILAVGDIHGCFDKFKDAFDKANIVDNDLIIFLGDYTDRGRQNTEMIEFVINNVNRYNFQFLKGNHELMLIELYNIISDYYPLDKFVNLSEYKITKVVETMIYFANKDEVSIHNGTTDTLNEVINTVQFAKYLAIIDKLPFMMQMQIYNKNVIFAHAGINPKKLLKDQTETDCLWIRDMFYNFYEDDDIVIVGHTPVQYFDRQCEPMFYNNIIFCDTGSFMPDGQVSIIDFINGEVFQQNKICHIKKNTYL